MREIINGIFYVKPRDTTRSAAISLEERERAVTVGSAPAEATVGNAEVAYLVRSNTVLEETARAQPEPCLLGRSLPSPGRCSS